MTLVFIIILAVLVLSAIFRHKDIGNRTSDNWMPPAGPDESCNDQHQHHLDNSFTTSHHHDSGSSGGFDGGGHHG